MQTLVFGFNNGEQRLKFFAAVCAAGEMLLHSGEQRADVGAVGDKLDQAVELRTTLLTVDACVRMDFKNTVNQFPKMIVHSYTHLAVYDLDEQMPPNLTRWRQF